MKYSKWFGLTGVLLVLIAAFQPWVVIASKNIIVTGLQTTGTNFGKPALLNIIAAVIAAIFFMVQSVMAKRMNIFFCSFNLAWAFRNFIILSTCRAGECPEKKFGLYLLLIASVLMMIAALLPDVKLKDEVHAESGV